MGASQSQAPHWARSRPVRDGDGRAGRDNDGRGQPGAAVIGPDDRAVELEIVAAVLTDLFVVVHVMPTALRS